MRKLVKLAGLLVSASLLITSMVGCGNEAQQSAEASQTTSSASTAAVETNPYEEHFEITIGSWDLDTMVNPDVVDPLYESILKKFNISIKTMSTTWDDYIQKIQTWAASDSLPDIIAIDAYGQPFYNTWVKEGIVKQIPNDLSNYPNIKKIMDMDDTNAYRDADGNFYAIPKPNYTEPAMFGLAKGMYVRKDWMQAVGITEDPKNMDEFVAMVSKIMQTNPGGAKDLVGVTSMNKAHLFQFMLSYAPEVACASNNWVKDDAGTWQPGILTARTKTGLLEMNKLYINNILDKDIPILKGQEGLNKFLSGRAVVYCEGVYKDNFYRSEFAKLNPDKNFDDTIKYLYPWPAENGKTYRYSNLSHWSESYFSGKMSDDKYKRVLEFFDYMLSEEGLNTMRFGELNKDYKINGDQIEITRPIKEDGTMASLHDIHPRLANMLPVFTWNGDMDLINPNSSPEALKSINEAFNFYKNNTVPVESNFRAMYIDYEGKDKTIADPTDNMLKVIMSKDAAKEYENMYNELSKAYEKAIPGFNKACKDLGIE